MEDLKATVDMSDPATRYVHCDCGGWLFYDDKEGTAHCYDCGSHERYIPKLQTTNDIAKFAPDGNR